MVSWTASFDFSQMKLPYKNFQLENVSWLQVPHPKQPLMGFRQPWTPLPPEPEGCLICSRWKIPTLYSLFYLHGLVSALCVVSDVIKVSMTFNRPGSKFNIILSKPWCYIMFSFQKRENDSRHTFQDPRDTKKRYTLLIGSLQVLYIYRLQKFKFHIVNIFPN